VMKRSRGVQERGILSKMASSFWKLKSVRRRTSTGRGEETSYKKQATAKEGKGLRQTKGGRKEREGNN